MSAYCNRDDIAASGINAVALAVIPTNVVDNACEAASALADSYFRSRYQLPLGAWGDDVRSKVAIMAAYDLMVVRGYNPNAGADTNIRQRYEDAIRWFEKVSKQEVQPDVTPTQAEAPGYDDPRVLTSRQRGWGATRSGGYSNKVGPI